MNSIMFVRWIFYHFFCCFPNSFFQCSNIFIFRFFTEIFHYTFSSFSRFRNPFLSRPMKMSMFCIIHRTTKDQFYFRIAKKYSSERSVLRFVSKTAIGAINSHWMRPVRLVSLNAKPMALNMKLQFTIRWRTIHWPNKSHSCHSASWWIVHRLQFKFKKIRDLPIRGWPLNQKNVFRCGQKQKRKHCRLKSKAAKLFRVRSSSTKFNAICSSWKIG